MEESGIYDINLVLFNDSLQLYSLFYNIYAPNLIPLNKYWPLLHLYVFETSVSCFSQEIFLIFFSSGLNFLFRKQQENR